VTSIRPKIKVYKKDKRVTKRIEEINKRKIRIFNKSLSYSG